MSILATIGESLMSIVYTIYLAKEFGIIIGLITTISISVLILIIHNYIQKRTKEDKEFQEDLIDLALIKAKSSKPIEYKLSAYEKLYQIAIDDKNMDDKSIKDKAYYGLCGLLKDEKDKFLKSKIISLICMIAQKRNVDVGTKQ